MSRHSIMASGILATLGQALRLPDADARALALFFALNGLRNHTYEDWRSLLSEELQQLVRPLLTLPTDVALRVQFALPSALAACQSCGAVIVWETTPAGKACPYDLSGRSHFTTCPYAREHSKRPLKVRA